MDPFLTTVLTIGSAVTGIISKDAVISGITGNRADALFCKCLQQIYQRLKTTNSKANHDLQRAIRKAQLESIIGICGVILERNGQSSEGLLKGLWNRAKRTVVQDDVETYWINTLCADFLEELSEISKYKYLPPSSYADDQIELLLHPRGEGVADRLAQLKEHLLETILIEIRLRHPNPPAQFIDIMRNGWEEINSEGETVYVTWFSGFCNSFAYELKNNQIIANIFQSQLLANLTVKLENSEKLPALTTESIIEEYQDLGGVVSAKLLLIETNLSDFRAENQQEFALVKNHVDQLLPVLSIASDIYEMQRILEEIFTRRTEEVKDLIKSGLAGNEKTTASVGKQTENSILTALNSAQNRIIEVIEKNKNVEDSQPLKIAILYKRSASPDEELLKFLEKELTATGHHIFIDRHLKIGVEWAKEIEHQIRSSDIIILLLSALSVQSEMLSYEIQIAYEESHKQDGKPLLIPIRINFDGPLPSTIAKYLDHLQHAFWNDDQDKSILIDSINDAILAPPEAKTKLKLEMTGGAVPIDSKFYITRTADPRLEQAIQDKNSIILIKGPRQVGKTSALARGLKFARNQKFRVVLTDFQQLNFSRLDTIDKFYLSLCHMMADQLDLKVQPESIWRDYRAPNLNFEHYLRREVLGKTTDPVVWGLDEADMLLLRSYSDEAFGFIRSIFNARALDPNLPWHRLSIIIAYATEAHLLIKHPSQSPFNVGVKLTLDDFSFEQLKELNGRYGNPLQSNYEMEIFFGIVGGHPYLVRRGLQEIALQNLGINSFESVCYREDGPFGDHLRRFLVILSQNSELSDSIKAVIGNASYLSDDNFYRLHSAGLLIGSSARDAKFRCKLYEVYLKSHLT